jgi:hypothetical protein
MVSNAALSGQLSAFQFANLGSAISLRSIGRFAASCSALKFVQVASSVSIRAQFHLGSGCSIFGACRVLGSTMKVSVLDVVDLASSLSMRCAAR